MKRFFNTVLWFILLLIVLAILGVIFLPQTAVQFFGEEQKNSIRATLGCESAIVQEVSSDFDKERDTINEKLDIIIQQGTEENDTTDSEDTTETMPEASDQEEPEEDGSEDDASEEEATEATTGATDTE